MLLGCRKSSSQIDVVLYEKKQLFNNCSTTLTIERAERDKDTSEQQLHKNIRNHQTLVKEIGIGNHQNLCRLK